MKFEMPRLGKREIDFLTTKAMDSASWNLSHARDWPDHAGWAEAAKESNRVYEAWVNYSRQTFPEVDCNFMLESETHFGAMLPFDRGDRWEHNGTSWTIVKASGERIITEK